MFEWNYLVQYQASFESIRKIPSLSFAPEITSKIRHYDGMVLDRKIQIQHTPWQHAI